jgi:hypothetical protein
MNIHFQHSDLAAGRWFELTLDEQMGNIGAEVGRAINWKNTGNSEQEIKALHRALELFDLSLQDRRWDFPKLKEIARAREVVCDFLVGDNEYNGDDRSLNDYFAKFAIAAQARR